MDCAHLVMPIRRWMYLHGVFVCFTCHTRHMVYLGSLQNDVLKMSCGTMGRWEGKKPRICV